MDLSKVNLSDVAANVLARRGIDPATVAPLPAFDPTDHLVWAADESLGRMLHKRFRTAEPDNADVLRWIDLYLQDSETAPSLLLLGPVGTGKTHQAAGALRRVVLTRARAGQRMTYAVTTHPTFNQEMRPDKDEMHLLALDRYQRVDLLVFDDLGVGKDSGWTDDTLHRLFDYREWNSLPTIVTTNLGTRELNTAIDERVVSRCSPCIQVAMVGKDRRRAQWSRP